MGSSDLGPIYLVPWTHISQRPKRHLGRFSRFCLHCNNRPMLFSVGRTTTKIAFGPPGLAPKWHLDQFNRFRRAHECDQQTHTDIPTAALATLHAQLPRPHRFVYFCVMTQQDVHGDCQRWSKICVGTFLVRKVQSRGKTLKFELILTVKMKTRHHIWW